MYGLFTYIWVIFMVNVRKYTSPMDAMGMESHFVAPGQGVPPQFAHRRCWLWERRGLRWAKSEKEMDKQRRYRLEDEFLGCDWLWWWLCWCLCMCLWWCWCWCWCLFVLLLLLMVVVSDVWCLVFGMCFWSWRCLFLVFKVFFGCCFCWHFQKRWFISPPGVGARLQKFLNHEDEKKLTHSHYLFIR